MENQINKEAEPETIPVAEEKKGISILQVDRYIRFLLFVACIGLVYIWNANQAEKKVRRVHDLETEVRELKADYSNLGADLSYSTRRSVLEKRVDSLGLVKMDKPPYMLN